MSSHHDRTTAPEYPVRGCRHINRIRHALTVTGFPDHLRRIENCSQGDRCGTSYCPECRKRNVRKHTGRMLGLYRDLYNSCEDQARKDIRFVTVLHELCGPDIKEVKAGIGRAKVAFAGLRRSFPGLRIEGRFELEVIDTDKIFNTNICPQKSVALADLNGGNRGTSSRELFLIHSHFLVFMGGNDDEVVRDKFASRFPGRYRIKFGPLFDNLPVEENIRRVCSYLLKDRYFLNHGFDTQGYNQGEYIRYESLSFLIRSYMSSDIGIHSSMIYTKGKS